MLGRISKVENEPGAFKVLLTLVEGEKYPKQIAGILNLSPPTVVFHLNRLRLKGLVYRTEKQGKEQPYAINWPKIRELFLETTLPQLSFPEKFPEYEKFHALVGDPVFQQLLFSALQNLANLIKVSGRKAIRFRLLELFKGFSLTLSQIKEIKASGSPLFDDYIKELQSTRHFDEKSAPWLQALATLGLMEKVP